MVYESTNTYELKKKNLEDFQEIIENILQTNLKLSTKSAKLDESLIIITFLDENKDKTLQKDNKIALYQEKDNVYVQVKGELSESEVTQFWGRLEQIIKDFEKKEEKKHSKYDIMETIINSIEEKGFKIEKTEAEEFINNFQEKFNRLPLVNEINSIAMGYIKMKQAEAAPPMKYKPEIEEKPIIKEQEFTEEIEDDMFSDDFSDIAEKPIEIEPSDALKEIIKDFNFLEDQEKEYYIKMLNSLEFEEQKTVVNKIEKIQSQLMRIPELGFKMIELRKELISYSEKEIRDKINEIKEQIKAEEEGLGWDPERELRKLRYLTEANINNILKMIKKLPENRQSEVIERIKDIEEELNEVEADGIELTEWERASFRLELVKLTKNNRSEKIIDLIKDKKEDLIKEKLFSEVPQLKYEDNEKLIKELIWLNKNEMDKRINKIKVGIQKQLEKKQELFTKSSAGSTCPNCGWPVGSFSKKCVRCGYKLIDWL